MATITVRFTIKKSGNIDACEIHLNSKTLPSSLERTIVLGKNWVADWDYHGTAGDSVTVLAIDEATNKVLLNQTSKVPAEGFGNDYGPLDLSGLS